MYMQTLNPFLSLRLPSLMCMYVLSLSADLEQHIKDLMSQTDQKEPSLHQEVQEITDTALQTPTNETGVQHSPVLG